MLKIDNIAKSFKGNLIFQDVTMTLEKGNIYGFIGPNGCGKSVFFKSIAGFLKTNSGKITYNDQVMGEDIDFLPSLGVLIEKPGFIENYTHKQNLKYLASINNKINDEMITQVLIDVGLDPNLKLNVHKFSLGMRQRLGIAQAIMEDQSIIILDEPFNGLDQAGKDDIIHILTRLRNEGKIILLTSHISGDIELLSDEVFQFNNKTIEKLSSNQ